MRSRFISLSSVLSLLVLAVTILLTSSALARSRARNSPQSLPEIDPAGLVAAGTLLVGGLAIARGRRHKD